MVAKECQHERLEPQPLLPQAPSLQGKHGLAKVPLLFNPIGRNKAHFPIGSYHFLPLPAAGRDSSAFFPLSLAPALRLGAGGSAFLFPPQCKILTSLETNLGASLIQECWVSLHQPLPTLSQKAMDFLH